MTDQDDLKTALSLMDKHWAGDQNAKELIRACCANQCLPHPLQYCADGAIRPVTRVPVIEGLEQALEETWGFDGAIITAARAYAELQKGA